jgi:hypothetical protein
MRERERGRGRGGEGVRDGDDCAAVDGAERGGEGGEGGLLVVEEGQVVAEVFPVLRYRHRNRLRDITSGCFT